MDADFIKELLNYDPETGVFTWRHSRGRVKAGDQAGYYSKRGYVRLRIDKREYPAHHIAWLMVYGYLPEYLDHINRDPSDNRIANLRECTHQQNLCNKASGTLKGIRQTPKGRWQARIQTHGRQVHLGTFDTPEEAHEAYRKAAIQYHGQFACFERESP